MSDFEISQNPLRRARGRPRDWYDKTEQNTIKSLDRALMILETLSNSRSSTLTELANTSGQVPATVYRVLITMEKRGIVEFEEASQTWTIGANAYLIGSRFLRRTSLVGRARPVLRRLMDTTGETANLAVERDGQVLFLSQVETQETIRAFFPPGTLSPMHSSGIGKALLAQFSESRLKAIVRAHGLPEFTKNSITNFESLICDLEEIRQRGFSIDNEERNDGMKCVAAAVFDSNNEAIAGLSISGPTSRLPDDRIISLGKEVKRAALDLSRAIGANI
ncbi:MAG: IclR family transcriptional regulator [Aestuariivita sp.]|nr:IclR family transcriptional regulator [Aestuariivita sp.]